MPQAEGYLQYCTGGNTRPWCNRWLPSIYAWVQEHYWGVGFLRYWVPSNIPLFLLATPMLYLLIKSGLQYVRLPLEVMTKKSDLVDSDHLSLLVRSMALAQLILAVLAITNYFGVYYLEKFGRRTWLIVGAVAQTIFMAAFLPQPA